MLDYAARIRRLRELGPRTSGNPAHTALIDDVGAELEAYGYEVHRDTHQFERWDVGPDDCSLRVNDRDVTLSSAWPYSGETSDTGITAPLIVLRGRRRHWAAAAGKIAVIEVRNLDVPAKLLLDTWDGRLPFETLANPVIGSELAGTDLAKARAAGVLAVIAVWQGIADAAAHGQYLPFTRDYQNIPAVWVPESERSDLLAAAEAGESATLTLPARKEPASMDTLWAVSAGTGPRADEAVLVVTHSDGGNAVEENGHLGLLALAEHAAATPHNRSVVFVYTAGHLRIPAMTKHGQATTAWLDAHPEIWSPDTGEMHAVAGLVIEHLGAKHFAIDASGAYTADGSLEPELLYATTRELAELVGRTWSGVDVDSATPVKPGALVHLGEGEPLFENRIPAVALVTGPLYLLAEIEDDIVDIDVAGRQIDSFSRLLDHLTAAPAASSFGTVRLPSKVKKLVAAARALRFATKAK